MGLKSLIELLARCIIMRFSEESSVYLLQDVNGEFMLAAEVAPGLVRVHPCRFSDDQVKARILAAQRDEEGRSLEL